MDFQAFSDLECNDLPSVDAPCQLRCEQNLGSSDLECNNVPSVDAPRQLRCEQENLGRSQLPPASSLGSNLPEPPEEPLQSDCCGTGCSPCVFDIYQDDLAKWRELAQLSPEEREARLERGGRGIKEGTCRGKVPVALSVEEYREFEVVKVEEVCSDVFVYEFGLPPHTVLGVNRGQHMTLRLV